MMLVHCAFQAMDLFPNFYQLLTFEINYSNLSQIESVYFLPTQSFSYSEFWWSER